MKKWLTCVEIVAVFVDVILVVLDFDHQLVVLALVPALPILPLLISLSHVYLLVLCPRSPVPAFAFSCFDPKLAMSFS